jgi:O-antigen ligase
LLFLIAFFRFKESRKRILGLVLLFAIGNLLFMAILWPEISSRFLGISTKEQAVTLRIYYNDIAISAVKERPILGLGAGNFVWYLSNNYQFKEFWLYQPVHNLYLLIASEIGIFGLLVFLIFIGFNIWKSNFRRKFNFVKLVFLLLVSCFLFLALIDHYFWTIQQSRLLFWIGLAVISASAHRSLIEES